MIAEPVVPIHRQPWRIGATLSVFAAFFVIVGMRLHQLQIEQAANLSELGERQRLRTLTIRGARGNLYDAHGVPLAVSTGTWTVYADPTYMDDRLRATVELGRILEIDRDVLRKHFESRTNGRKIMDGLGDERADAVRKLRLSGIDVRRDFTRIYPEGNLASHVLGFVSADGNGGAGIEQQFNTVMQGMSGKETIAVDALGHPSIINEDSVPARPGAQIQLTIDVAVQRELEAAIAAAVEKHRPKNVAGIVLRPQTGEIMAMASWPAFDPRDMRKFDEATLRNNVLSLVYEPGSTIKPLIAGAAVVEGLAHWNERINCENGKYTFRVGRSARSITDHSFKDGGHQQLTVVQGIALSDNVLMAKLGVRLGPDRLYRWIHHFNFGRQMGISLPGEDAGIVLPRKQWNVLGSCLSIPIGHEIAVTPLQMAMAHAAIANGGMWQPPRLVSRIYQEDPTTGQAYEMTMPTLPDSRRSFSPEDAAQIQEAMTHTMTEGTGEGAKLDGYSSAGKTGTAEKLVNGRYSRENHVGSFVCWAPAERGAPAEALAMIVIDDPQQNGHYGSQTAAPVVQRVLQFTLEHLEVPKRDDLRKNKDVVASRERR
jgi:cell division protein FtsI (penicillin-binding protein 3)